MSRLIRRFIGDDSGTMAIAYGLIAALIAVGVITAATTIGTNLSGSLNNVANIVK